MKNLQSHFFTAVLLSSWTWSPVQTTCGVLLFYVWTLPLFSYSFSINLLFFAWGHDLSDVSVFTMSGAGDVSHREIFFFTLRHHLFCLINLISKRGSVTCRGVSFQPVLTCVSVRFQVGGAGRINANYGHLGRVLTVTKFWSERTASLSSPLLAPVGQVLIGFF